MSSEAKIAAAMRAAWTATMLKNAVAFGDWLESIKGGAGDSQRAPQHLADSGDTGPMAPFDAATKVLEQDLSSAA